MPRSHQSDDISILSAFETAKIRMIDVDLCSHPAGPPAVSELARDVRRHGAFIIRKYCNLLEARLAAKRRERQIAEVRQDRWRQFREWLRLAR
jgi:hypothetical protein